TAVSDRDLLFPCAIHEAWPVRSPLYISDAEVTSKVALTRSPGAIVFVKVIEDSSESVSTVFQPFGAMMLRLRLLTGAPVVFVNETVVFRVDPGANVCSPGGVSI